MVEDLIPKFERESGIDVTYVSGEFPALMTQIGNEKDRTAKLDMLLGNTAFQLQGDADGLWADVPVSEIPNLTALPKELGEITTGVPIFANGTGIVYNTEALEAAGIDPPTDYEDLFDPRLAGRVTMYDMPLGITSAWIAQINESAGGTYDDVAPGMELIETLKDNIYVLAKDPTAIDQALSQGTAWMAFNSSQRALLLKETGAPVDFVIPEGGSFFINYVATIASGSAHTEEAGKFINFLLSKEIQDSAPDVWGASAIIPGAEPAQGDNAKFFPTASDNTFYPDWAALQDNISDWTEQWSKTLK